MNKVDRAVYEALPPVELYALIASMSADELHEYVLAYNWDNGADAMLRVVERDDCDLGTALTVFWLADPTPLFDGEGQATGTESDDTRYRLLRYIHDRILGSGYSRKQIRVDPVGEFIPNRLQRVLLQRQGVPAVFLGPTPGSTDRRE